MILDMKEEYKDIQIKRDLKEYFEINGKKGNWDEVQEMIDSDNINDYGHLLLAYDITVDELKEYLAEL